jgi:hypothetical protein
MRQWLGTILLIVAGVILALALCEGGLRFFGIEYPQFYEFDPFLGARLRPGIKGYWLKEGSGHVSINSDGLRDQEHTISKPPRTLRIAILGDSFAEAMQVNREEAFWAIMEKELQNCENLRKWDIEVINFGQAGFGTTQELLAFRHRAWKYTPDIVLLAFCTGNDLADNSPVLNQRATDPFYVFQGDELVLDDSRTKRAGEIWLSFEKNRNWLGDFYIWRQDNLRILQVIQHAQKIVQEWWPPKDIRAEPREPRQASETGVFTDIYREPTDEVWKEAWGVTEALLLKMRDEIAQNGAQFYVVVITNDIQVHPNPSERAKFASSPEVDDLFYPDHRIESFCQSHGIPVLLLGPYFQKYAVKHKVFLHGFVHAFRNTLGRGHWNQNGHRLAGQTIAKWLCPQMN